MSSILPTSTVSGAFHAEQVLDALLEHVAVLAVDGTILAVNDAWVNFARDNGILVIGRPDVGINYLAVCRNAVGVDTEGAREAGDGIADVLSGAKKTFTMEYPCHSPTEKRWFLLYVSRLSSGGAVVSHINITARRMSEDAVVKAHAQLNDRYEEDKRFFSIATHQLKTPLAGIKWQLEAVSEMVTDQREDAKAAVQETFLAADRLSRMVRDILLALRSDDRSTETAKNESFMLAQVISDALSGVRLFAEGRHVTIESSVDGDLAVVGPKANIAIVIDNLISNAVKYNTVNGSVRVRGSQAGDRVTLTVSDTGIGIPKEDIANIGQKFYRASNASDEGREGTGLGLYISRHTVERLGGQMTVESVVGKGTSVTIVLPNAMVRA